MCYGQDMVIERVGVVGCGLMGSGIAEVCARAGLDVVVVDADDACVKAGQHRIEQSLANAVRRGKLEASVGARATEALRYAVDLEELAECDLVIEAIIEAEGAKTALFRRIDDVVSKPDAILATNTSSIP